MTEHEFEQVAAAHEMLEATEAVREWRHVMLTNSDEQEFLAHVDALIAIAAQSSEVAELRAVVKHWRSNHDIAVQRKRVKDDIIRDLRAALEDALMGLAIFGGDNHPGEEGEVTRAIDRGRRVLSHVREPFDG